MTLRVLHVGKFYPPVRGGMELYLHDLIAAQRAAGIDATALVHGRPEPDDPPWLVRVPVQLQLIYAPIAVGFRRALARAIQTFEPDVLHLHMPNNACFWALTLPSARARPWLVHWHSDVVLSQIRWSVAAAYALYRPFERAVLDRAECIVATSEPYLNASAPLAPWRHKCAVVPLGIDTRAALPALPANAATTGAGHWHAETRLRLLSIGRLTYYKGFETLIRALQHLPGAELLIAGDGELRGALQALIDDGTRAGQRAPVRLLGNVGDDEKHALLAGCDIFCLASRERTEAFGLVLLEAMQHARPCLVTDLPGSGLPWVVAAAGCGLPVPIEDTAAWQGAITRLQFDAGLRARLGAAGQRALGRRFDVRTGAAAIARRYRLLAPARPAAAAESERGVLVALSTHNDAATIGALLRGLRGLGLADVLVLDHRSTDGCDRIAQDAGATVLRPLLAMTRWGGVQTALRWALERGHAGVLTLDGGAGPAQLQRIDALLAQARDADLVLAGGGAAAAAATDGPRHYGRRAIELLTGRAATLLDDFSPGVGLLLRQGGLRVVELPPPPGPQEQDRPRSHGFDGWPARARAAVANLLLRAAHWRRASA